MATVILTREQRNGLQDFVAMHLEADSLGHLVRDGDGDAVKVLVHSLPACIRVLDQVGWERKGSANSYEITLDEGVREILREIAPHIEGTIRDDLRHEPSRVLQHDIHAREAVAIALAVA